MVIGITYTESGNQNYPPWIKGGENNIDIIQLGAGNLTDLKNCNGIILSGGVDTHPRFYKSDKINYPFAPEKFDEVRDETELQIFYFALENKLPVLAICRGMQLVNIALGGDLIQDIEASGKSDHKRSGDVDGKHEIIVNKHSLLYSITGMSTGIVNSAHHQALGNIAPELMVNAYADDGIAESAEWNDKSGKPFLLCVQWHPERLAITEPENKFAKNIRIKFLEAVRARMKNLESY